MFSLYLVALFVVLLVIRPTRKLALMLLPWLLFACCYDGMRFFPNYEFNDIDVRGLYEAEKSAFGVTAGGIRLTPNEWFATHHCALADVFAGLFYLCWVPVPMAYALSLYVRGRRKEYLRFSVAFLFVNLIGFCGYYIHPAAPPWYVMKHGFDPILNTPGNTAALGRFDALVGIPIFERIYGNNANVFAAIPSLHAAYMIIATFYAAKYKERRSVVALFAVICVGIWWTAVYSWHHYIIDVLLGIATACFGLVLFEIATALHRKTR